MNGYLFFFGENMIADFTCYVHNFGETGNAEHVVNFVGDIRDGKTVFSEGSATDQTNSQKGGRNKHDISKIKGQPNIVALILKIGHSTHQNLLEF